MDSDIITIPLTKAHRHFAKIVHEISDHGSTFLLTRCGRPAVCMTPVDNDTPNQKGPQNHE